MKPLQNRLGHPLLARTIGAAWLFALLAWIPDAAAHPQDGPHADIRYKVTDEDVALNLTLNLAFTDEVCPALREAPDALHPLEEPPLYDAILEFLRDRNRVEIDGVRVPPRIDAFEVLRPGAEHLPLFPNTGMRGLLRAQLEVTYTTKSPPERVALHWAGYPRDAFGENPDGAMSIEAQLIAQNKTQILRFTEGEPEFTWHAIPDEEAFLKVPAPQATPVMADPDWQAPIAYAALAIAGVSLILTIFAKRGRIAILGAALLFGIIGVAFSTMTMVVPSKDQLTDEQALAIFQPIHANIYRAFDYESESDIYDALAQSVDGPLLDALYRQIYRSLIMDEGAVGRVSAVEMLEASTQSVGILPDRQQTGFVVRANWRVEGTVYHWGHSHVRLNEYTADYTVVETPGGWRIADNTIIEQFRVDPDGDDAPLEIPGEL